MLTTPDQSKNGITSGGADDVRPIGVSACLLGENCKYNGGNNRNEALIGWLGSRDVVPVCPEVMGGLPTPRPPAEMVDGVVQTADGSSVDKEFHDGAQIAEEKLRASGAGLVILQSRSPSCGARQIYDGTFTGTLIDGEGTFARQLRAHGYEVLDVSEFEEQR